MSAWATLSALGANENAQLSSSRPPASGHASPHPAGNRVVNFFFTDLHDDRARRYSADAGAVLAGNDAQSVTSQGLSQASTRPAGLVGPVRSETPAAPGATKDEPQQRPVCVAKLPASVLEAEKGGRVVTLPVEAELRQEERFVKKPIDRVPRDLRVRSGADGLLTHLAGFLTFNGEAEAESVWVSRLGIASDFACPDLAQPGDPFPGAAAAAALEPEVETPTTFDEPHADAPPAATELVSGTLKQALSGAQLRADDLVAVDGRPVVVGELYRAISIPSCLRCALPQASSPPSVPSRLCESTTHLRAHTTSDRDTDTHTHPQGISANDTHTQHIHTHPHTHAHTHARARAHTHTHTHRLSSTDSDTNECAVCLEPLEVGTTARLRCGHMFHKDCIAQVRSPLCNLSAHTLPPSLSPSLSPS